MRKAKLFALANEFALPTDDKPVYMQFGTWPFNDKVVQTFDLDCAKRIISALDAEVAAGRPGTPVYQGHPDVPSLAQKYPDKSAWGWIRKIELADADHRPCAEDAATGVIMHVDWVTRPKPHAFEYFSPYWIGEETAPLDGKTHMLAREMRSVALLNYPNIKDFRLPNEVSEVEEVEDVEKVRTSSTTSTSSTSPTKKERNNIMPIEELKKLLGLPPEATEDQVRAALEAAKAASEAKAADEQKLAAANQECEAAKTEAADAKKEAADTKTELENERQAHAATKQQLANEQQKYAKLEQLKTQSVTAGLPNEAQMAAMRSDSEKRMALVNECRQPGMSDFDAWTAAKRKNPDLFK